MDARTELVRTLRTSIDRSLIALDFDGTLAPLVPDPSRSRLLPGTLPTLQTLGAAGAQIAVVTGRDAATVVALGGLQDVPGLVVEGLYGLEQWTDGTLSTPPEPDAIVRLRSSLPPLVAPFADLWVEDKRLSLVVHGRRAADPEAALDPLRAPVAALAERLGLEMHPGNGVLEVRLPGYDKGGALRRLIAQYAPVAVLFAGDDLGDLPAFAVTRELAQGWSIAVGSGLQPDTADLHLPEPAALAALLGELAG